MRPGFVIRWEFAAVFRVLSPEDCKSLILAALDYGQDGTEPEGLTGQALEAWPAFRKAVDRDGECYEGKTRGKRFGGYVNSCRAAGTEPLSFGDWKQAGEPNTA